MRLRRSGHCSFTRFDADRCYKICSRFARNVPSKRLLFHSSVIFTKLPPVSLDDMPWQPWTVYFAYHCFSLHSVSLFGLLSAFFQTSLFYDLFTITSEKDRMALPHTLVGAKQGKDVQIVHTMPVASWIHPVWCHAIRYAILPRPAFEKGFELWALRGCGPFADAFNTAECANRHNVLPTARYERSA